MLKPKLFSILKHRKTEITKEQLWKDFVSGIIVAIIALPLSVALAIASGVTPDKGLITAVIAGFLISALGGSRVQIGGPTGAFVVIVYGIIQKYGISGLTIATIMAGIFMIFFGLMRFGSVIKFIPYPITTGFTTGIAIVLFSTQLKDFLGLSIKTVPSEFFEKWHAYLTHFSTIDFPTVIIGLISLAIIIIWPRWNKTIPGSLPALIIATLLVKLLHLPVDTIGSRFGTISNSIHLINFGELSISMQTIKELIQPAITIAFLASIESLLSAVVADGMIGKKHNSNMELIAQGIANIASALFGGIPATGAIARTAANVKNGGRTPIAGMIHGVALFFIMVLFMPFANLIPMPTLAAILIIVAYNMSEWHSFRDLLKSTKSDISVLLVTFTFTVVFDLVVAIEIGMILAMFLFVKRMSESTQVTNMSSAHQYYQQISLLENENDDESEYENNTEEGIGKEIHPLDKKVSIYEINGPMFFGAANSFLDMINEFRSVEKVIVFKMTAVPNIDATALQSLKRIQHRCKEKGILVYFSEVNDQPLKILKSTGFISTVGADCFFKSTKEAIERANLLVSR